MDLNFEPTAFAKNTALPIEPNPDRQKVNQDYIDLTNLKNNITTLFEKIIPEANSLALIGEDNPQDLSPDQMQALKKTVEDLQNKVQTFQNEMKGYGQQLQTTFNDVEALATKEKLNDDDIVFLRASNPANVSLTLLYTDKLAKLSTTVFLNQKTDSQVWDDHLSDCSNSLSQLFPQ